MIEEIRTKISRDCMKFAYDFHRKPVIIIGIGTLEEVLGNRDFPDENSDFLLFGYTSRIGDFYYGYYLK